MFFGLLGANYINANSDFASSNIPTKSKDNIVSEVLNESGGISSDIDVITKVSIQDDMHRQTEFLDVTKLSKLSVSSNENGETMQDSTFNNGKIVLKSVVNTHLKNSIFEGIGKLNLNIINNGTIIYEKKTELVIPTSSDSNGLLEIKYLQNGETVDMFSLNIETLLNLFKEGKNTINFSYENLILRNSETDRLFYIDQKIAYRIDIEKINGMLYVKEQNGIVVNGYTADNEIKYCTFSTEYKLPNGNTLQLSKVNLGSISVYDSTGLPLSAKQTLNVSQDSSDIQCLELNNIPRDIKITLKMDEPTPFQLDIQMPKSQKTMVFACTEEASINKDTSEVVAVGNPQFGIVSIATIDNPIKRVGGCNFGDRTLEANYIPLESIFSLTD